MRQKLSHEELAERLGLHPTYIGLLSFCKNLKTV